MTDREPPISLGVLEDDPWFTRKEARALLEMAVESGAKLTKHELRGIIWHFHAMQRELDLYWTGKP